MSTTLTDALRRHGWREMPIEEHRAKWENMGGRWMALSALTSGLYQTPLGLAAMSACHIVAARPVHPDHGWSFAWWMWAEITGESLVPTETGYHWVRDRFDPTRWMVVDVNKALLACDLTADRLGRAGTWLSAGGEPMNQSATDRIYFLTHEIVATRREMRDARRNRDKEALVILKADLERRLRALDRAVTADEEGR